MEAGRHRETSAAPGPDRARGTGGTAAADEVRRFDALADAWWDSAGEYAPLHRLNPIRIAFIRDRLCAHFGRDPKAERPLGGLRVLDAGCGGGLLCEPMARLGASMTGIDAGERSIGIARNHARRLGLDIDYRRQLPEDLAAEGAQFDAVLNMEVIEHVADAPAFMTACGALVRADGAMALATLNRTLKSLALAKVGAEYLLRWLPAGTHDWRKFVRPSELASMLRAAGLDVAELTGVVYEPFAGEWRLGRDLGVNYMVFAVKR